jgi:hypothetical protein
VFVREHLLTRDGTRTALLDRYAAVLRRDGIDDDPVSPVTAALKLSGIVGARDGRLRVRNRIYARLRSTVGSPTICPTRRSGGSARPTAAE